MRETALWALAYLCAGVYTLVRSQRVRDREFRKAARDMWVGAIGGWPVILLVAWVLDAMVSGSGPGSRVIRWLESIEAKEAPHV